MDPKQLHVISVISNPCRYRTRATLFDQFKDRCGNSKANHWFVEAVFGNREFAHTHSGHPNHIQLRCDEELWIKEAMLNVAITRLPQDWKYVMWMDADIQFVNPDWERETIEALQHYAVVQPFSHAVDLGPDYETMKTHTGFAHNYINQIGTGTPYKGPHWHPGYAWAWRREAWNAVGGMIDWGICGAGDNHMALGLLGRASESLPKDIHPNYRKMTLRWQDRALRSIRKNIGYVPGTIVHYFHGNKANRNYTGRWKILTKNYYDPEVDIVKDWQGMPQLTGNKPVLRDDLRRYFRERKEDQIA